VNKLRFDLDHLIDKLIVDKKLDIIITQAILV